MKKYTKIITFVLVVVFLSHMQIDAMEIRANNWLGDGTRKDGKRKKSRKFVKKLVKKTTPVKKARARTKKVRKKNILVPATLNVPKLNMRIYGLNPNRSGPYRASDIRVVNPNPNPIVKIDEITDFSKPFAWLALNCITGGVMVTVQVAVPDFIFLQTVQRSKMASDLKTTLGLTDVVVTESSLVLHRASWSDADLNKIKPAIQASIPDLNVQEMLGRQCNIKQTAKAH